MPGHSYDLLINDRTISNTLNEKIRLEAFLFNNYYQGMSAGTRSENFKNLGRNYCGL